MAKVLNAQFQSVFTTESQESCSHVKRFAPAVPDLVITEPGVNKLLRDLMNGKASGVDNLPTRPLKECADNIPQVLTFIFNLTLARRLEVREQYANLQKGIKRSSGELPTCNVDVGNQQENETHHLLTHRRLSGMEYLHSTSTWFRRNYSCETQLVATIDD